MSPNDGFRRYVEAGAALGQITRARAEEIVRDLVNAGEVQRGQTQNWIDDLVERSRRASEELLDLIRTEVSNQLGALGIDPDDLARQVADILKRSADVGKMATDAAAAAAGAHRPRRTTTPGSPVTAAGTMPAGPAGVTTKAAAKKAAAKKAAGPKKAAKKAAATTATAKKAAGPKKAGGTAPAAKKAAAGPAEPAGPAGSSTA